MVRLMEVGFCSSLLVTEKRLVGSMEALKKERIEELDVLRGLAFLAVVYQHVIGAFINKPDLPYQDAVMLGMIFNLLKFAVPAFVMITGITLLYNYYEKIHYPSFLLKRTKEIFIPYLCWTVIYFLYAHRYVDISVNVHWMKEFAREIFTPTIGYHLWYIVMIFQFYIFYPLILAVIKWCRRSFSFRTMLVGLVASYMILMWLSQNFLPTLGKDQPWLITKLVETRTMNALFYFIYFAIGGYAALKLKEWRNFTQHSIGWNTFMFWGLFIIVGYELIAGTSTKVILGYSTSLKNSMFFFTLSSLLLVYSYGMKLTESRSKLYEILRFIGRYSFGAYLAHALVITLLSRLLIDLGIPLTGQHSLTSSFLLLVCSSALSVFVTIGISRLPLGKLLVGSVPAGKKQNTKGISLPG